SLRLHSLGLNSLWLSGLGLLGVGLVGSNDDCCDHWCYRSGVLVLGAVFGAFDQIAVGIALAFATIAAATLATRATARALAVFVGFVTVFLVAGFVVQQLFIAGGLCSGWARLALFTRRAWLTLLARLALDTLLALSLSVYLGLNFSLR